MIKIDKPIVLSLCDLSGIMVEPWKDEYFCITLDINHPYNRLTNYGLAIKADITQWKYPEEWTAPIIVFAFPPCTDVAISGAAHFQSKGIGSLIKSLEVLQSCIKICETATKFAILENPVSTFSSYWRLPDYIFHPWHYALYNLDDPNQDAYTKKTCLWKFGNFVLPKPRPNLNYDKKYIHYLGMKGQHNRSLTPKSFAIAIYEANK